MVGMMGASASAPAAAPSGGTDKAMELLTFLANPAKAKAALDAFAQREAAAKQAEASARTTAQGLIEQAKIDAAAIRAEAETIRTKHQNMLDALKKEMASYLANIEALKVTP